MSFDVLVSTFLNRLPLSTIDVPIDFIWTDNVLETNNLLERDWKGHWSQLRCCYVNV